MTVKRRPEPIPSSANVLISWDDGTRQPVYIPTFDDRLWLLRAVEGEGPKHDEVAQVLVNRFLYLRARLPKSYASLADLIQAYSQPVNPLWMRGGEKWEAAWRAAKTPEAQAKLREIDARRQDYRARTTFSATTRAAVEKALTQGSIDIPPTAVHFAAPNKGRKQLPALTTPNNANWLHTEKNAEFWGGYRSSLQPLLSSAGPIAPLAIGVVLIGMLAKAGKGK